MQPLKRVSASQVETYKTCPRKWYFQSILKIPQIETEALKNGTEIHAEIEKYLLTGIIDQSSKWYKLVEMAQPHLPKAPVTTDIKVEHWIEQPTYDGGPLWVGKIDMIDLSNSEQINILDNKTCKNFTYAQKTDTLGLTTQMNAYAHYALFGKEWVTGNTLKLTHLYLQISVDGKAKVVQCEVDKEQVKKVWQESLNVVREMSSTAAITNWEEIKPNTNSCSKFGGCQFREKCGFLSEIDIIKREHMDAKKSLKERLAEAKGSQPGLPAILPPDAPSNTSSLEEVTAAENAKKTKKPKAEVVSTKDSLNALGLEVYVDCYPESGTAPPILLTAWLNPLVQGLNDVDLIKIIKDNVDTLPKSIVVCSGSQYADEFLDLIYKHAKIVVKSLRR
jgi:RecB family exonuclease